MAVSEKRILVIAYACEPGQTSEPGVGWYFTKEIAKNYSTLVLTRENNKKAIANESKDTRNYLYYDLPSFFLFLKRNLPLGTQFYYAFWQWGAYRYAKNQLRKKNKDVHLVHHLNFGVSWIAPPAFLFKKPFVWGPIGGGDIVPWKFLKSMSARVKFQEAIYYCINRLGIISPLSYMTRAKVAAALFRTNSAKKAFHAIGSTVTAVISETATNEVIERLPKKGPESIRAICVGRMNYWKGFIFAVKGFHRFLDNGGEGILELFGEGTELARIENYIRANELEKNIFIRGFVTNAEIKRKMETSNVLLHPSFREGGSWAIMEAMSYGLPVICLDTSGPSDMVTNSCGILIELDTPDQIVNAIGKGLQNLLDDHNVYENLSRNAIDRVKNEYSWDRRGGQIAEIYENVLSS